MKGGKKIYKSFALAIIHAPFIVGSYYNEMNPSLIMIVVIEYRASMVMEFLVKKIDFFSDSYWTIYSATTFLEWCRKVV